MCVVNASVQGGVFVWSYITVYYNNHSNISCDKNLSPPRGKCGADTENKVKHMSNIIVKMLDNIAMS